jgi:hypothetical protein
MVKNSPSKHALIPTVYIVFIPFAEIAGVAKRSQIGIFRFSSL